MILGPEDQRITIEEFNGLFDRGSVDEIPRDHAQDCQNLVFTSEGHVTSRKGFSRALTLGYGSGIRRFFLASHQNPEALAANPTILKLVILDDAGNLYLDTGAAPIYTKSGMTDFTALNIGNRTFICPNNGSEGFQSAKLQILDLDTSTVRQAAGGAPEETIAGHFQAAESVTAGSIAKGVHKFLVVYETDTGFWTPPGPKYVTVCSVAVGNPTIVTRYNHGLQTGESHRIYGGTGNWAIINDYWIVTRIDDDTFSISLDSSGLGACGDTLYLAGLLSPAQLTANGGKKITLTNIPTGPAYVKKRIILATRAGEEVYYFVPNKEGSQGIIADNVTTTATVDFFDTDLVASADYLFDLMEVIPAGSAMQKYRGRLVIAGTWPDYERLIISRAGEPESFNMVNGTVQIQTERDGNAVRNCFVLRDTLYAAKFVGIFATEDNGSEPSTWAVTLVDGAVGAYNYGTSSFTVSQPAPDTGDIVLLASRSGLYLFDGVVRRPELSWKVQDIWLRFNFNKFYRVTVAHDIWNHRIYVAAPIDSATEPNYLLVGDYSDGRDYQKIRWTPWKLHKNPTAIGMAFLPTDASLNPYKLRFGSIDASSNYLWGYDASVITDDGVAIEAYWKFAPLPIVVGEVGVFKVIRLRVRGVGTLELTLTNEDNSGSVTPPSLTLSTTPGKDLQRFINFVNEKMALKLRTNNLTHYWILDRADFYGCSLWPVRPSV